MQDEPASTNNHRLWQLFNLVYLLFFFSGWIWQRPQLQDVLAIALAIAVFLPVYFDAYDGSTPRVIPHIAVMEGLAWALSGFAGLHGVFHVYACVQSAFQRPRRRALLLIGVLSLAYTAFSIVAAQPLVTILFNVFFGIVIGTACIGSAETIEREHQLRRSRVLERQHATLAERERIAHELHDLLGHTLTMVALKAEVAAKLMQRDPERARIEIGEVADAARDALGEIRSAVYDMTATSVESEIELARRALDAAGVSLEVSSDVPPEVAPAVGKALGLTIREATTNIVRHSRASAARIELARVGDRLRLIVSDNGVGTTADGRGEGAGISGLRNRVAALGGDTIIERDRGMHIRVSLPIQASAQRGSAA
jgi:two-component system sensor histidine kinase DesK